MSSLLDPSKRIPTPEGSRTRSWSAGRLLHARMPLWQRRSGHWFGPWVAPRPERWRAGSPGPRRGFSSSESSLVARASLSKRSPDPLALRLRLPASRPPAAPIEGSTSRAPSPDPSRGACRRATASNARRPTSASRSARERRTSKHPCRRPQTDRPSKPQSRTPRKSPRTAPWHRAIAQSFDRGTGERRGVARPRDPPAQSIRRRRPAGARAGEATSRVGAGW